MRSRKCGDIEVKDRITNNLSGNIPTEPSKLLINTLLNIRIASISNVKNNHIENPYLALVLLGMLLQNYSTFSHPSIIIIIDFYIIFYNNLSAEITKSYCRTASCHMYKNGIVELDVTVINSYSTHN